MITCPHCHAEFVPTHHAVTPVQLAVLQFIESYTREHDYSPSFSTIATHFGYKSLATVFEHVNNLERKGVLSRHYGAARSIRVLVRSDELVTLPVGGVE